MKSDFGRQIGQFSTALEKQLSSQSQIDHHLWHFSFNFLYMMFEKRAEH